MALGFVIERSGLLLRMLAPQPGVPVVGRLSFWIGIGFIVLGAATAVTAVVQYRAVLRTLKPVVIPEGYRVTIGIYVNILVALLGAVLTGYLIYGMDVR